MTARRGRHALPLSEELVRAIVRSVADDVHGTRTETICDRLDETPQRLGDALEFVKEKRILLGFGGLWFHPERYVEASDRFLAALADAHRADAANGAVPPGWLVSRADLGWTHKATSRIVQDLVAQRRLKGDSTGVRLPDFVARLGAKQEITLGRLVECLSLAEFRPPVGPALAAATKLPSGAVGELLRVGEHAGRVVPMEHGIWTTPEVLDRAHTVLASAQAEAPDGTLTIAEARTALATSRRYAHAFLIRLYDDARAEGDDGAWRVLGDVNVPAANVPAAAE